METSDFVLRDPTLSFKAKGIFFYILQHQGKPLTVEDMTERARDKHASTSSGVRELMDLGYIKKRQRYDGETRYNFYNVVEQT